MSQADRIPDEENDRNREPGSSLAKAPDLQQNYDQAQQATEPLQPATPGPTRPPITAAQQYDPIQALPKRQPANDGPNLAGTGDQAKIYSENMKAVLADVRAELTTGQAPEPEIKKSLNEHDPSPTKTPFTRAANAQPPETHKEKLDRVTGDIRAEQGLGGSQMIQQQAPTPRPTNTMPEAKIQDAKDFDKQWSAEQARAAAYQKNMKEAIAEEKRDQQLDAQQQSQQQGHSR